MKELFKNKLLVAIIILILIFVPLNIGTHSETESRAIVIGVGVDYEEEAKEFVISSQVIIPHYSSSFSENLKLISARGESIEMCFENLSLHLGKRLALAHANILLMGQGTKTVNYSKIIDFFIRSTRLNNNCMIALSDDSTAKDVLETITQINNSFTLSLNNVMRYNSDYIISVEETLAGILDDYYKIYPATLVPIIKLSEQDDDGIPQDALSGQSGGQSSGQDSGGSEDKENKKTISNTGEAGIYKMGTFVDKLSIDKILPYKILKGGRLGLLVAKDVCDNVYDHATVTSSIGNKSQVMKVGFKNGIPYVKFIVKIGIKVEDIMQDTVNLSLLSGSKDLVTEALVNSLKTEIKSQVAELINYVKNNNVDILNIYETFYKFCPKKFIDFASNNGGIDGFLSHLSVYFDLDITKLP